MEEYDLLSENKESTVVARYERPQMASEESYQSEAQLERSLIEQLRAQGYEYADITEETALIRNLRTQLEALNGYAFTDNEWSSFFRGEIATEQGGIEQKAETMQQDYIKVLHRDDGSDRNIRLIDKRNVHANRMQVISQYKAATAERKNRYDVTILVNGLPLVHIELKRRGVDIREAFNQIDRYGRDTFCSGSALFEYVQLFVISNGTLTKYYSNTTRRSHIRETGGRVSSGKPRPCHSFEFTNYWADAANKPITDLDDFARTFFSRHTLLNVLTRYCVLTEQKLLLAMRPYQIAATERLIRRIEIGHNARLWGKREGGGYVWHTTGSGKTLTSFKAAQLATQLEYIDKVFFVVDRKDLDYQTMKEYDRFQKGAANGNTSTKELTRQINSSTSKIIITTIQKLSNFVKGNKEHDIYRKEVVMIFDECHRSQFGQMHRDITKKFKKYYIFGFTGTPIFAENISSAGTMLRTTDDVFGRRLHTYTIVDAIRDHNVLPFRLDYISTIREKEQIADEQVYDIQRNAALNAPERIRNVVEYILNNFDRQTKRQERYAFTALTNVEQVAKDGKKSVEEVRTKRKLNGFNAILATQSIDSAKLYYNELKGQMAALPENKKLKVATIFTYAANEELRDGMDEENPDSADGLDKSSRDFLGKAIDDYNKMFGTSYDTSDDNFPNYYKDVSLRMKNREIDLLVVVNMFLTGFDATTLNTLWVDKNLRYHGLLQAFSRTNRILNSVKNAGNIVCFRNLEEPTNKALALFGDSDAHSTVILRKFEDYFNGYTDDDGKHVKGYVELVKDLKKQFSPDCLPEGEKAQRAFIALFGSILRAANMLSCFDRFEALNPLSERDRQDYTSLYIELREQWKRQNGDGENINDDIVFEMELIKQVEVSIDYILYLVGLYHDSHCQDAEIRLKIIKAIDSGPDLRDKKELIMQFVDSLTPDSKVYADWLKYVNDKKREEFNSIITEEKLKKDEAVQFIERAFVRGYVPESGMEPASIMPSINPFDPSADRAGVMARVIGRIKAFFKKYYTIADDDFGVAAA